MVLIKKKDVKSYFAARRDRHPLHVQPAKLLDSTNLLKVERDRANADSADAKKNARE